MQISITDQSEQTYAHVVYSDTEYTTFLCAEDFDGNISPMLFEVTKTKGVQVGDDPTLTLELVANGSKWDVLATVDHDVEYFKWAYTDEVKDFNIPGATQSMLSNIAGSGIPYEKWYNGFFDWVSECGGECHSESMPIGSFSGSKTTVVLCLAIGRDGDGNPVEKMYHLICKDGKSQTLEEIFGL